MVDGHPKNYESLSQPGLKELLNQRSSKYRKEAYLFGGVVVGSAIAEGVAVWNAVANNNFTTLNYVTLYMIGNAGLAANRMLNKFSMARQLAASSESLSESKTNYNTAPHNFVGIQADLEAVADLPENKLQGGKGLLMIAKHQERRMPFINKFENTGDLGMLEAQKDTLQQAYFETTLKGEEFVVPELKTRTTDNEEFTMVKDAWIKAKITECNWAIAVASGNVAEAEKKEWLFYATNMRLDQGLNGKLAEKAAVIINNRSQ